MKEFLIGSVSSDISATQNRFTTMTHFFNFGWLSRLRLHQIQERAHAYLYDWTEPVEQRNWL